MTSFFKVLRREEEQEEGMPPFMENSIEDSSMRLWNNSIFESSMSQGGGGI